MQYFACTYEDLLSEHLYFSISHKHQGISEQWYSQDHSRWILTPVYLFSHFQTSGGVRTDPQLLQDGQAALPHRCVWPALRGEWRLDVNVKKILFLSIFRRSSSTGDWTATRSRYCSIVYYTGSFTITIQK